MWPKVHYETYAWNRASESLEFISKTQRRKITPTYEAALPALIAHERIELSDHLLNRVVEASVEAARFDAEQAHKDYNLPALMLRSESSSSSQIERLTSSVRNVALAEVSDKVPQNARLIAGNVAAMREALSQSDSLDIESICAIHDVLMANTGESLGIRCEQVWIGGAAYSPHGATFVPPHETRVVGCLQDLMIFGQRNDIVPLVKAAIFHAQFETIHPFTDGNGRTGRALLHRMLAWDEVLQHATLPISAGLLHDIDAYMRALSAYHDGEVEPIIEQLVNALELAVVIGSHISKKVDAVLSEWSDRITERKGSAIHRLPALLVEQPVVDTAYVARNLSITDRAARALAETACERGILTKMGNAKRGAFYQAADLIALLEEASSLQGIRRIATQQ